MIITLQFQKQGDGAASRVKTEREGDRAGAPVHSGN